MTKSQSTFAPMPKCPSPPMRALPAGACDTHAHIFGPADKFPLAGGGSYDPPLAPYQAYRDMLSTVGAEHGVLVQPAAYLSDHSAILDACVKAGGCVRGIGLAHADIIDHELAALQAGGIIGLRFVEVADPKGGGRFKGSVGFDELIMLAPRLRSLGMQAHLWADCERLVADAPMLQSLGLTLVVDHMGRPDVRAGASSSDFQKFVGYVSDGLFWVKLSLCRVSTNYPDYPDARPFHDALIAANPDRLVWGSDWPHIRLGPKTPDIGHLLDIFDSWTDRDEGLRVKIFAQNTKQLFGF